MAVVSHLRILFSFTATCVASTKLLGPYFYVHVAATAPTSVPALAPSIYVQYICSCNLLKTHGNTEKNDPFEVGRLFPSL